MHPLKQGPLNQAFTSPSNRTKVHQRPQKQSQWISSRQQSTWGSDPRTAEANTVSGWSGNVRRETRVKGTKVASEICRAESTETVKCFLLEGVEMLEKDRKVGGQLRATLQDRTVMDL